MGARPGIVHLEPTAPQPPPSSLVSGVSGCPLPVLARSVSTTVSEDKATALPPSILQDSITSTAISWTDPRDSA
ncbi:hypothetical protein [Streptomyces sp. NPDC055186]